MNTEKKTLRDLSKTRFERSYKIPEFLKSYGIPSITKGLLDTDPLLEAEKITGKSYKESEATTALGFLILQQLSADKEKILGSNSDTTLSMKTEEWEEVIEKIGFKEILCVPFVSDGINEKMVLAWLEPGILLRYDTFNGYRNASDFHYCWKADRDVIEINAHCEFMHSGSWTKDGIMVGHTDAREALRYELWRLFTYGTIVSPWPEKPFLWLLHYMDTKAEGYDYKSVNEKRLSMLPKEILNAMGIDSLEKTDEVHLRA